MKYHLSILSSSFFCLLSLKLFASNNSLLESEIDISASIPMETNSLAVITIDNCEIFPQPTPLNQNLEIVLMHEIGTKYAALAVTEASKVNEFIGILNITHLFYKMHVIDHKIKLSTISGLLLNSHRFYDGPNETLIESLGGKEIINKDYAISFAPQIANLMTLPMLFAISIDRSSIEDLDENQAALLSALASNRTVVPTTVAPTEVERRITLLKTIGSANAGNDLVLFISLNLPVVLELFKHCYDEGTKSLQKIFKELPLLSASKKIVKVPARKVSLLTPVDLFVEKVLANPIYMKSFEQSWYLWGDLDEKIKKKEATGAPAASAASAASTPSFNWQFFEESSILDVIWNDQHDIFELTSAAAAKSDIAKSDAE